MQKQINEERYFQHLPPKRIRDAQRLSKWADEAIEIFFKGVQHDYNNTTQRKRARV